MAKAGNTGVRPTIRMVAELAGVSTATVSYVLSGRRGDAGPGVSDPTAEKVKAVAERLGYRPNQAARAIRTGRTNTVILSLTMLSDPWSLSVIEAVQKAAAPLGITPMILGDADWVKVLGTHNADAVFVDAVRPDQRDALRKLAEHGTTLVVFDEGLEPDGFDVIRSIAGPGLPHGRGAPPPRPSKDRLPHPGHGRRRPWRHPLPGLRRCLGGSGHPG
ncbi:LacI family DNA-binding transcriptional regulator [Arthrobacter sp. StoSoilB13]|uniref:LacI family DNA-binding transcriptional regulator n=1 Tax=Arthrobacter sp. StoSoilB13 TaxID=2830993 RepID=UPI001CC7B4C0|nr:LacI family DNA-binding transcriptional regulator [Arthrobacter sp. StoSoilB13]BCW51412.1 hypothetical protein StoSoilB13_37540 [Arthrobacter sp. StoSoilB13]